MNKKNYLLVVPFIVVIFGLIGFSIEGYTLYEALLASLKLLKVHLDPLPSDNLMLEFARWTGVLFFFGLIYSVLITLIDNSAAFIKTRNINVVAVHGDSLYADLLISALGKRGLKSRSKLAFHAARQVILFNKDEDAIDFYQKYISLMENAKEIYIGLSSIKQGTIKSQGVPVTVVNFSDAKAIDYWKDNFCSEPETIIMIGSGEQAISLLKWGLLMNVFSVNNKMRYVLIGDYEAYFNLHPDLKENMRLYGNDEIIVLDDDWTKNTKYIKESDRVILCDKQNKNIKNAASLLDAIPEIKVHVCIESSSIRELLDSERCKFFGDMSKSNIEQLVLMDGLYRQAKLCDASYIDYEDCKNDKIIQSTSFESVASRMKSQAFLDIWNNRGDFIKGSNLACALHDKQKIMLMNKKGIDSCKLSLSENVKSFDSLNEDDKKELREIEHIRWARYHWLNNWKYSSELNRNKDSIRRLHSSLVPFQDLPKEEAEKDSIYYYTLPLRCK